jgi:hypothetical protein
MEKRFQECNWLEKFWRYRWYLYIPIEFLLTQFKRKSFTESNLVWSLMIGEAQYKMRWYYTSEEIKEKLKNLCTGSEEKDNKLQE